MKSATPEGEGKNCQLLLNLKPKFGEQNVSISVNGTWISTTNLTFGGA